MGATQGMCEACPKKRGIKRGFRRAPLARDEIDEYAQRGWPGSRPQEPRTVLIMAHGSRFSALAIALLMFAGGASAQTRATSSNATPSAQSGAPPPLSNAQIRLDVVVDSAGQAVTGLQQQNFTVMDGKASQTITSFAAVNGRAAVIQMIVVIDAVNADYQNVLFQRQQLDKFLRSEGGNLAYPMAIALLADDGLHAINGKFLNDGNALSAALNNDQVGFRSIRRSGGYYGAAERFQICLTAMHRLVGSVSRHAGRKVIVWLSPGWPLLSGPNTELDEKEEKQVFRNIVSLSNEMLHEQITVYSIDPLGANGTASVENLGSDMLVDRNPVGQTTPYGDWAYGQFLKPVSKLSQATYGDLGLPVLVIHSGGVAFSSTNGIAERLRQCIADTVPYYELTFTPPTGSTPDEYHPLQVKVAGSGMSVRTSQGYYAEPGAQSIHH